MNKRKQKALLDLLHCVSRLFQAEERTQQRFTVGNTNQKQIEYKGLAGLSMGSWCRKTIGIILNVVHS